MHVPLHLDVAYSLCVRVSGVRMCNTHTHKCMRVPASCSLHAHERVYRFMHRVSHLHAWIHPFCVKTAPCTPSLASTGKTHRCPGHHGTCSTQHYPPQLRPQMGVAPVPPPPNSFIGSTRT